MHRIIFSVQCAMNFVQHKVFCAVYTLTIQLASVGRVGARGQSNNSMYTLNCALQCACYAFSWVKSCIRAVHIEFCEQCTAMHCSYILFSVRFRTDSSSVRKKILKNLRTFSEPIPVRFGIFGMDFLITFPNRFQFGSEKLYLHLSKKFPK